jgi:acyl-CoA thioester hydrolase
MSDNNQSISVRVYYEDTDFSGRVYHASYLRYFERGRTEWLRNFGFRHNAMAQAGGLAFAVTKLEVDFLAGAAIDDLLEVSTRLLGLKGPVLIFEQSATRDGLTVARARVSVVAIRGARAVRPPREILAAIDACAQAEPTQL